MPTHDERTRPGHVTMPISFDPPLTPKRSPQGVIVGAVIVLMLLLILFLAFTSLGNDQDPSSEISVIPPSAFPGPTLIVPVSPSPSASADPAAAASTGSSGSRRARPSATQTPRPETEETHRDPSNSDNDDAQVTVIQGESGDDDDQQQPDDGARRSGDNKSGERVTSCPSSDPDCANRP